MLRLNLRLVVCPANKVSTLYQMDHIDYIYYMNRKHCKQIGAAHSKEKTRIFQTEWLG